MQKLCHFVPDEMSHSLPDAVYFCRQLLVHSPTFRYRNQRLYLCGLSSCPSALEYFFSCSSYCCCARYSRQTSNLHYLNLLIRY